MWEFLPMVAKQQGDHPGRNIKSGMALVLSGKTAAAMPQPKDLQILSDAPLQV